MTSRVSFLKLIKETLRRHIAAVLITVLVFVIHMIAFFLNVQNALDVRYIAETLEELVSAVSPQLRKMEAISEAITELSYPNLTNGMIAMFMGAYLAFDFFRYMHSKRETDFYDSLPIRKQKWFVVIFTTCFGIFTLSCIVTTGVELAIVYGVGYGSGIILQNMLWNLLCMIGIFLASWVTTALAMIMTGHSIVAFLGVGVIASYVPLILYYLVPVYASKFFETYVEPVQSNLPYYFSPVTLAYKAIHNWTTWNIAEHWTYLVGCFVFAIVVGVVSYLLFLRRPSESAGRAMAFEKVNFIIRFLLVIPLALYTGLFLSEMSSYASIAWLIFGVIFAAFLIHGIMECIFQFDIKALISKKRQLILSIILCLGFVFIFWADVFRYDAYMPKAEEVKAVKIDSSIFDQNYNDVEAWSDGLTGEYVDDALAAIKDIRKSTKLSYTDEYRYMNDFTVTYQLKNGATRIRRYSYYEKTLPESLANLYTTEAFKNGYCIFYHLDKIDITSLEVNSGPEGFILDLSEEEQARFIEMYLEEYTKLTLTELLNEPAVCEIVVYYSTENGKNAMRNSYNVYAGFTNTLSFLKEHGFVSFNESENIKLINLEFYGGKYEYEERQYISDEAQLKELQKYMILGDFMNDYYGDEYIYCDLRYEYNESTNYMSVYLKSSDIDKVLGE